MENKNLSKNSITDSIEDLSAYTEALQIKKYIGYTSFSEGETANLKITADIAKYLIGSYSQNLGRYITIHDLPSIDEEQKNMLLGMESPILNRKLNHYDLFREIPEYIPDSVS